MLVADLLQLEVEADTLAAAVDRAVRHFDCSRTDLETAILQAPTSGFFGRFGRRPAKVTVRLTGRLAAARRICQQLVALTGFEADITTASSLPPCELQLASPDAALLIGRHGQTLESLQSLLNSLLDRHFGAGEPVILDVEGYRKRRKGNLTVLAQRLIDQARKTGRTLATPPLPVEERKVLQHLFERESDIVARAKGEGAERKLLVSTHKR